MKLTYAKESKTLLEWINELGLNFGNGSQNKNETYYLYYNDEPITVFNKQGYGLNYFEILEELLNNTQYFMPNEDIGSHDLKYSLVNN